MQRPRRGVDAELRQQPLLDAGHEGANQHALFEPQFEVAVLVQFCVQPALFKCGRIGAQLIAGAACGHGVKRSVSGQHAALDGGVAAFDAGSVQVASVATNECAAWEHGFGQGLWRAVVDGACTVANAFGAFEVGCNRWVGLPALHFFKGAEPRVFVVEAEHKAEGDFVVFQVVQKSATEGVVLHGPARGVHHQTGLGFGGVDFPQLFDADGVALWVAAFG